MSAIGTCGNAPRRTAYGLRMLLALLFLRLGATGTATAQQAVEAAVPESLQELEAILVTGERPGPALWKVTSKKGHALWILPVFGPLPDRLVWKATEVESVIRVAQAVYIGGRSLEGTTSKRTRELALRAVGNTDGKLLAEVLPPDLFEQFTQLSRRFADGPTRFQRYRPYYAMELLREIAMVRLRLASDGGVVDKVRSLADRFVVKVITIESLGDRARAASVAELDRTPREADIPCVRVMLARMDEELRASIDRANAWSSGDVEALRDAQGFGSAAPYKEACSQFLKYQKSMNEQNAAARRAMYSAYEGALRKNESTLALVWAPDLLDASGLIARFRKDGYTVHEPMR